MDKVIREGGFQLLVLETPCDVVLSCKDRRLSAHRLILSLASPVLQRLLLQDTISEQSVLIFPDIHSGVMGLVLDYIYNGYIAVPSYQLNDFTGVIKLLDIHLDPIVRAPFTATSVKPHRTETSHECLNLQVTKKKKTDRKVPNLMPIGCLQKTEIEARKGLYNKVFPSPWCPREGQLLPDPRRDCSTTTDFASGEQKEPDDNDKNNNLFLPTPLQLTTPYYASHLLKNYSLKNSHREQQQTLKVSGVNSKVPSPTETPPVNELKSELEQEKDDCKQANTSSKRDANKDVKESNKETKEKPFKCQDCGKSFSQLRNYKYHRSIHEGTKEFAARCTECGKVFNDRGYLSSHMKIHRDRKEYACPHCPKRFNQRVAYNMHLRIHTGIKPHECSTCGKTFSRKMLLKQHQRVHTGERPYVCPECGKSFADRSNMSLHARLHTGVKPYACNLCSKSFTKKHHLKTHMNFHTGLKPYTCQKCGLAFSQSSNMRTHYKKCLLKNSDSN